MKSVLATTLGLASLAVALPALETRADRVLPTNWAFTIKSLKGPGCPDFGADPEAQRTTRLTYGQNTVDGSEIYYWFVAYPYLRVSLAGEKHSWCETELSYKEYKDNAQKVPADDYRLRLHKNGTRVIATYDVEEGAKARLEVTYEAGNDEVYSALIIPSKLFVAHANPNLPYQITDAVVWKGPRASGQYQVEETSPASKELYKFPKCGSATIKFRTDLYIEGKGKKSFVASEFSTDAAGKEQYYGVQEGFSYDFEKCKY
jgi:hypothetical protein